MKSPVGLMIGTSAPPITPFFSVQDPMLPERQRKEVLIALASNFRAQMDVDLHINRESKRKKIREG